VVQKNKDIKSKCKFIFKGYPQLSLETQFKEISQYCKKNNISRDFYGDGFHKDKFEAKIAKLLGFESGLFFVSGTMAQQIALRIIKEKTKTPYFGAHKTCHLLVYENKAYQRIHGLKPVMLGKPNDNFRSTDILNTKKKLGSVIVELPARDLGGRLIKFDELSDIKKVCKKRKIHLHLDGARLWETKPYYQKNYKDICKGFQSVYVSFYKGIGAMNGAMLLGNRTFIEQSKTWQHRMGGRLFQVSPSLISAEMNFDKRLKLMPAYYKKTKQLYDFFNDLESVKLIPETPQTNLFRVLVKATEQDVQEAREAIARKHSVWICNIIGKHNKNTCFLEMYVGDNLLKLKSDFVENVFKDFIDVLNKKK